MFVQYKRMRFCALTKELFIQTGNNPNSFVITISYSLRILTFSSMNFMLGFFALNSFSILTYSKNSLLRGSLKLSCLPAKLKPWHGEPPTSKSILGRAYPSTWVTSPNCMVSGKLSRVCAIAYLSISEAKYLSTFIPNSFNAILAHDIPSKRLSTFK